MFIKFSHIPLHIGQLYQTNFLPDKLGCQRFANLKQCKISQATCSHIHHNYFLQGKLLVIQKYLLLPHNTLDQPRQYLLGVH